MSLTHKISICAIVYGIPAIMLAVPQALASEIAINRSDGGWAGNIRWTQHLSFKQDKKHRTVALSGLNDDLTCATRLALRGRVVTREFYADGVSLKDFVVETPDGERDDVSVVQYSTLDIGEFPHSVVENGLQRLTRPERLIRAGVVRCGADGSNLTLDQIE